MIRRLRGQLVQVGPGWALVETGGLAYQVMLSPPVRDRLAEREPGAQVDLHTYYYLQTDGNRVTPYLLGFDSEVQREFFETLLEVPRLGPLSALRAMILPVGEMARAIELGDEGLLRKLPGVARQRARDLVASLQGKLARFLDGEEPLPVSVPLGEPRDVEQQQALEVLVQVGLPRPEALRRLQQIAEQHPAAPAEELVRLVFQQK